MNTLSRIAFCLVASASWTALGASCGSEADAAPGAGAVSRPTGPLPAHETLRAFLPASLPERGVAHVESEAQPRQHRVVARGRYMASLMTHGDGIELEISSGAQGASSTYENFFRAGMGERTEVAGFDAVRDESEFQGRTSYDLYVRVSPEVWIQATGHGSLDELRDAVTAIDLDALAAVVSDGSLFDGPDPASTPDPSDPGRKP